MMPSSKRRGRPRLSYQEKADNLISQRASEVERQRYLRNTRVRATTRMIDQNDNSQYIITIFTNYSAPSVNKQASVATIISDTAEFTFHHPRVMNDVVMSRESSFSKESTTNSFLPQMSPVENNMERDSRTSSPSDMASSRVRSSFELM